MDRDKKCRSKRQTIIDWFDYNDRYDALREFGWCLVVLKPKNFNECDQGGLDYADWVLSYGFEKAWWHGGKFYVANPHCYGTEEVTNRVALIAPLPKERII